MSCYILTWRTHHHSGMWSAVAADPKEAESRLRRWIQTRYPGQRVTVTVDSVIPA